MNGCDENLGLKINNQEIQKKTKDLNLTEASQWFNSQKRPLKGVFVVVHGLNLKPSKMNPIVSLLNKEGFKVLRVTLDGHKGSLEEQRNITLQAWLETYHRNFCLAKKEAELKGIPLYHLSFSLGALIGLAHLNYLEENYYQKMILLAPAAWTKAKVVVFNYLKFLPGKVGIPSMAHEKYRSQDTTSLNAYWAMSVAREIVSKLSPEKLNSNTLIFQDPKDEVISLIKLKSFITKKNLHKKWSIELLERNGESEKDYHHHLIIDESSLGTELWVKMQNSIQEFLTAPILR